ncbi:hypothetical protein GDO81_012839 [Engystomops pustulosus]|uniref:Uncharacterized protein n=1 Tax=Engystomops pustulosus TaxID=76066 RepID=A0AAV7B1A7_ENGPU|nr:hypothetical protein GDO81_012839 [Engystomops pustulosus]
MHAQPFSQPSICSFIPIMTKNVKKYDTFSFSIFSKERQMCNRFSTCGRSPYYSPRLFLLELMPYTLIPLTTTESMNRMGNPTRY